MWNKVVFLTLMKRRFRCLFYGKVFTEPGEAFGPRRRSGYQFREYLRREALHQTVSRTAQKEQVGEGLVSRKRPQDKRVQTRFVLIVNLTDVKFYFS
ncbi:hypothetical protein ACFLWC_07095 [Chloroflexota bacterium]